MHLLLIFELYPEAIYEWITHEAVISRDEVAFAIMGHRKIPNVSGDAAPEQALTVQIPDRKRHGDPPALVKNLPDSESSISIPER